LDGLMSALESFWRCTTLSTAARGIWAEPGLCVYDGKDKDAVAGTI